MNDLPTDFRLVLPPAWVRIPLDGRERARIVTLVAQRLAEVPVGARESLRVALTRDLTANVEAGRRNGATDVIISLAQQDGLPMAATCLASVLTGELLADRDALVDQLGGEPGDEIGVEELDGLTAVRRVRRRPLAERVLVDAGAAPLGAPMVADPGFATTVDWAVPLPGTTSVFVLSFSTPVDEIAAAMVVLFDAVARTLRFQW